MRGAPAAGTRMERLDGLGLAYVAATTPAKKQFVAAAATAGARSG